MVNVGGRLVRLAAATGVVTVAVALLAEPASAHVEVDADRAQAGAADVTLSFDAESESTTAGITSLRVVLPTGIGPADVTWVSGPTGWTLRPGADGYTVSGPALKPGADARYRVRVARLPADARTLAFRTLQTYADGRVDRWIEVPDGNGTPEHPAPVLELAPAAAAPGTSGPASPDATPPSTGTPSPAPSAVGEPVDGSGTPWRWVGLAALLAAGAALGGAVWRRRAGRADGRR